MASCDTKANKILNMRKVAFAVEESEVLDDVEVIGNDDDGDNREDPRSKQVEQ